MKRGGRGAPHETRQLELAARIACTDVRSAMAIFQIAVWGQSTRIGTPWAYCAFDWYCEPE
jgi:hypothetical protein